MSEFMIHREILRECGGDLKHSVKSSTTEQSSAEDIINILEEVTTRTRIGSHVMRRCHFFQRITHLANTCHKKGKINEIDIEKEPDVEMDEVIEDNADNKSSIFSEFSKDIENINVNFYIMEFYSHLRQSSSGQLYLLRIQDSQLMKNQPNRGRGHTAGNSCIAEVIIENKPTKLLLYPGAFCSFVGKSFLQTCVPNFKDQLLPIYGIKFNSSSSPMKALGILETTVIFPHINGNLRKTVEFVVMESFSSTHFILGSDHLIRYCIYLHNKEDTHFTIGHNKCQKLAFLPFKSQITIKKVSSVSLELEKSKYEHFNEAVIILHLTDEQESQPSALLYDQKEAFASYQEPLGAIVGHEVDIILNIERPYPPLFRRP
ncbi:hypothetical protein O181_027348 [Austropuccinia psidii MF-1]|uniref:Uncharacterized protein n=1 Tax=Austropuccinia psidii MF-1 TaxID=1389203 RepID=A0A9Q3CRP0_9BASI|nr:hypothetical protein [Austropuccinia psidii MF-1]